MFFYYETKFSETIMEINLQALVLLDNTTENIS